jgi:FHS family L-fucose permease-like MFS transporter
LNISINDPAEARKQLTDSGKADLFPRGHLPPFILVTALFFIWGMSNNLTDILVQQFKKSFELSSVQAQLVQTAVFFGYFCMALPAAICMRRWGYKFGLLAGLCLFGTGTLMFWPAAVVGKYWLMLTALFVVGCGSATLETAANPFIAESGPAATSERRLNFSQAFNPPGTITGVLVGTFFIFSGVELSAPKIAMMKSQGIYAAYLHTEIMRVVPTYVSLGCVVLLLAVMIQFTKFPIASHDTSDNRETPIFRKILALFRVPTLRASVIAQFCYCGAQVSTWSAFIPYVRQYTHSSERVAGLLLTGNLIAFAIGRLISTGLMRWLNPARMMANYAVINILLLMATILHPGQIGVGAILLTSFFMSIMFPTIFAMGIKGLGPDTKVGGSLIVMSVVGAAVIPPILGWVAKLSGSYGLGYAVVSACYLVVALYGLSSHTRPITRPIPEPV